MYTHSQTHIYNIQSVCDIYFYVDKCGNQCVCRFFFCMASAVLLLSARIQKSNPSNFCMDFVCQKDNMYVYTCHFNVANIFISHIGRAMFAKRIVVDSITRCRHHRCCYSCITADAASAIQRRRRRSSNQIQTTEIINWNEYRYINSWRKENETKRNKRTGFNWKEGRRRRRTEMRSVESIQI